MSSSNMCVAHLQKMHDAAISELDQYWLKCAIASCLLFDDHYERTDGGGAVDHRSIGGQVTAKLRRIAARDRYEYYRAEYERRKAVNPRLTQEDIARQLNISVSTIQRARRSGGTT